MISERHNPFRQAYLDFVARKVALDHGHGFPCDESEVNPLLKDHQRAGVAWMVRGGRRALFFAFGLGKTLCQIEALRLTLEKCGGDRALIVLPLNVRNEFKKDAAMLGVETRFVQTDAQVDGPGLYLTNYESVREGKIDPTNFDAVSLDEASILRGLGGTKTFREFMGLFEGTKTYRFVATATPSPNDYIELLAYAAFLDVMDVGQAKTRFFKRNSEKADHLTIFPGREREFWLWVSSWALFVTKPSDLGFSDDGYDLPPLDVRWHEIPTDHSTAAPGAFGQGTMFKDAALGLSEAAKEKRDSLPDRIAKMMELREEDPSAHRIIWHDQEAERHAIQKAIPGVAAVWGNRNEQSLEAREEIVRGFSDGEIPELAGKPVMLGSGCNLQRHCHWAIYLGIGFKFNDLIQSIHRLQRFLQPHPVRIDLIYTEAEREIRAKLEWKWQNHIEQMRIMTGIVRQYGLAAASMGDEFVRSLGIERQVAEGTSYRLALNDCVLEMMAMDDNTVHFVFTSIPFEGMYEYSPNYNDFGHTDDSAHFWAQMEFCIREMYRVLKPGRVVGIHVKDRITPSGMTGMGFQTVNPVSDRAAMAFTTCPECRVLQILAQTEAAEELSKLLAKPVGERGGDFEQRLQEIILRGSPTCRHRFGFLGRVTVVTDVVRENAQTYRLGHTEQCKDGSRQGFGLPEYVLYFRKPPTDTSNGYADEPVKKARMRYHEDEKAWENPGGYSRARWQVDAHGFHRSSGDRLLTRDDLRGLNHKQVFRLFRDHSRANVYDFLGHVEAGEFLHERGMLPPTFMLLQPQSWHPDVWTDVTRMRTMNTVASQAQRQQHLCPLQFDIVDRAIARFSMPGEIVYDPFAGLGTVPRQAVMQGRIGWGSELSEEYWRESCVYLREAEAKRSVPSLFDIAGEDLAPTVDEDEYLPSEVLAS